MGFVQDLKNGVNSPSKGEFTFRSSDHIRYQNGRDVSGHNYNCHRSVKIEPNISGGFGYTVTIFNDDSIHPLWGNNIQMAPKAMKVVATDWNSVTLQGFGYDPMGAPFSNYALKVVFIGETVDSCILYMLDRGVELHYLK